MEEVDATLLRHADGASVDALREERQRLLERVAPLRVARSEAVRALPLLSTLQVASPCKAAWETMRGDDRVRLCSSCDRKVYNLSAMTRDAAEQLLRDTRGASCVRFYRRRDGTVLTRDCPRGVIARVAQRAAAAVTALVGIARAMTFSAEAETSATVGSWVEWPDVPSAALLASRPVLGGLLPVETRDSEAHEESEAPPAPERSTPPVTRTTEELIHELQHPTVSASELAASIPQVGLTSFVHDLAHAGLTPHPSPTE